MHPKRPLFLMALSVLTLALVFTITGCNSKPASPPEKTPKTPPLRLGMLPIQDNLPFWVAERKGYFADEGLQVELIGFPSAMERDSALAAGQIDGALGDILAVAQLNNGGTKVRIVSVGQGATAEEGRFAILASPKSSISSVDQLKNVPIGCSLKTINEYVVDQLLTGAGLKPEEIKKNQMPKIPLRLEALLNGTLQAAVLPDPIAALAEVKGARLILDDTRENITQTVIYFREPVLEQNLEGVQRLMRAYARAVEDIQAGPSAFNDLLAEKARVPQEVLSSSAHGMQVLFSPPQLPTEDQVRRVLDWMSANGLLDRPLGYQDLVDGRVLGKA
ncbi:MAG: MetQ/NlpA family ABC transporter substrate-binding protein [Thermoanaerobacterales bacterium]|nr:MetQ/NlpA family ABC transporter substrate-binding protein [Bacillota bacterium]MDI6906184.1 MetQ/NlpA family ABC transporter substrate-binding protein [Thermoanaerobacterales bacterium]